jgi:hypothetical protein
MRRLRPVRLRPFEPDLLADLRQHFARSGFIVVEEGGALVVGPADAGSADQARGEIEAHLRVWQMMHPDVRVVVESD